MKKNQTPINLLSTPTTQHKKQTSSAPPITTSPQNTNSAVKEIQQKGLTFSSKKRNYDDSSCSAVDDSFKKLCLDDQSTSQPNAEAQVDNGNNQPDGAKHSIPVSGPLGADAEGTSEPPRQPITKTQTDNDNQNDINSVADAALRYKKRNYYEGTSSDTCHKKVRWDEQLASSSSSALPRPPGSRTVRIGDIPDGVTIVKILDLIITGDIESACLDLETHSACITFVHPVTTVALVDHGARSRLQVNNQVLAFSLEPSEPIASEVSEAIKRAGATRSVVGDDWSSTILSEETIKADFVAFGQVEHFKTDVEKRAAFINFTTIGSIIKAKASLWKDPRYLGLQFRFGKERCAKRHAESHPAPAAGLVRHCLLSRPDAAARFIDYMTTHSVRIMERPVEVRWNDDGPGPHGFSFNYWSFAFTIFADIASAIAAVQSIKAVKPEVRSEAYRAVRRTYGARRSARKQAECEATLVAQEVGVAEGAMEF
ncbi:hypothetical protein BG015_011517 [Linnemannia schmuckeri]|uniref:Uncharacterized protein n=1 Tax=Linnemannia schmuckeri TaxID=64567 RepID=A0A9P5RW01_9FUNG|nr:hypothetical protein BG015_011517 [Linnemannia schmuckeri]